MKELVHTFLLGSWDLLYKVFLIVIPIMVFLRCSRARGRFGRWCISGRGWWGAGWA
ncbi:MAG: hypothetical protein ACLQUT_10790 [Thermoleophilia bacterium]